LVDQAASDAFGNTSILFRAYDSDLSKDDRFAIQETLFLCETEAFLQRELGKTTKTFAFKPQGNFFKGHGQAAANELRTFLGYTENELRLNIFADLRKIGFHVFRRRLNNPKISGLFIKHPAAGKCIIVNYDEDVFRQRFTAAHEGGHAILDNDSTYNVSFQWEGKDLKEIRANVFASFLLIPFEFARKLPDPNSWNNAEIVSWASKLMLSPYALAIGLKEHGLINDSQFETIRSARIPKEDKSDPELPNSLAPATRAAKMHAMEQGLSDYYVTLALEAFQKNIISRGRLCEILLCDDREVAYVADLFGRTLSHGD
jgi:Zn-dependent peptidase ImmA (M78 family)